MVITRKVTLSTRGETDIIDITSEIQNALAETMLHAGIVTVFVPGSTGGITTIEFEPGSVRDLKDAFEHIAPRQGDYSHNTKWGDGNGFSHVRASLIGPSLSVPFDKSKLMLGKWQQVIFMDFDNRPREREIILQFTGEKL